jgi:hypothetical protein
MEASAPPFKATLGVDGAKSDSNNDDMELFSPPVPREDDQPQIVPHCGQPQAAILTGCKGLAGRRKPLPTARGRGRGDRAIAAGPTGPI